MKFIQRLVDASCDNGHQLSIDYSAEWHARPLSVGHSPAFCSFSVLIVAS
jgi:hypothetical protein